MASYEEGLRAVDKKVMAHGDLIEQEYLTDRAVNKATQEALFAIMGALHTLARALDQRT